MPVEPVVIEAYKGFRPDLTCQPDASKPPFQFEVGKTYRGEGTVIRCAGPGGFHSCEMPLDVWSYYAPGVSRFALVATSGEIARGAEGDDSKFASAEITIKAELKLPEFIRCAVDWVLAHAKGNIGTGDSGHAAATGDSGHAAATGNRGHAAATGYSGHAAATGYRGHAVATGDRGHAAATGYSGHAAATGKHSIAVSLGINGTATAGPDGWIVLVAWKEIRGDWTIAGARSAKVGGPEGIKGHVKYRLNEAGAFEEVPDP